MPDPKESLKKAVEAQRKMREEAERERARLEEERKRKSAGS